MVDNQNAGSKMLPMMNVLDATMPSAATAAVVTPVTRPTAAPERGTTTTVTNETVSATSEPTVSQIRYRLTRSASSVGLPNESRWTSTAAAAKTPGTAPASRTASRP